MNTRPPLRAVERAREAQRPRDESGSPHFPTGVSFHTWITVPETHPKAWVKGGGPGLRSHRRALKGLQGKAVTRRRAQGTWGSQDGPPRAGWGPRIPQSWGGALFTPQLLRVHSWAWRSGLLEPLVTSVATRKGMGGAGAARSPVRVGDRILSASEAGTTALPMMGDCSE